MTTQDNHLEFDGDQGIEIIDDPSTNRHRTDEDDLEKLSVRLDSASRDTAGRADTAVLRVGILRSESETMNNPAWDAVRMLRKDPRFRIDIFDDRNHEALFNSQHYFDCIILAHNVTLHNPALLEAVERTEFTAGLVIMQQREWPAGLQLQSELKVEIEDFDEESTQATLASNRSASQEVLLNWPNCILETKEIFEARALRGLVPREQSGWRVILDAENREGIRVPVLIRSAVSHTHRVAMTTLLLDVGEASHCNLMSNMAYFCGAGRPDTVIVSSDEMWRVAVARKLRLRGVAAVSMPASGSIPPFGAWPLRGVAEVFAKQQETLDRAWLEDYDVAEWLTGGGRLVRVSAKGRSEIVYQAPDLDWVARRFAAVLHAKSDSWHQSIMASRAVLSTLAELALKFSDMRRFGFPNAEIYRSQIRGLVSKRLGVHDSIDGTLATTAAAMDLNEVIPGVLNDEELARVRGWLSRRFEDSILDDQLEIARALRDGAMFARLLENMPNEVGVTTLTRMRQCAVAIGWDYRTLPTCILDSMSAIELESSVLVAGNYLNALAATLHDSGQMPDRETAEIDLAISTLRKRGELSGVNRTAALTLEELAAEARAIAAVSSLEGTSVGVAVQAGQIPPALVDDVLRETASVRASNISLQTQLRAQTRALELSRYIAGALAAGAPLLVVVGLVANRDVHGVQDAAIVVGGAAVCILVLAWIFSLVDLVPRWLASILGFVTGLGDKAKAWAATLQSDHDDERPPK